MNQLRLWLFLFLLGAVQPLFAQFPQDSLQDVRIQQLQKEVQALKNSSYNQTILLNAQRTELQQQQLLIDSIQGVISNQAAQLNTINTDLGIRIEETSAQVDSRFNSLQEALGKNSIYWMLAFLLALVAAGAVFFFLRRRLAQSSGELTEKISQTKQSLEEEGIKLDTKLAELLESQLKLWALEKEKALKEAERNREASSAPAETDHTLALKVADEIIRIQQNINHMDSTTRGLKQLTAAVRRIQDNFEANGYEIVDMLNKPFDLGMKVIANFRPDENLKPGEQIITRIVKPQVNFNGEMIQAAQVEVSTAE